MNIALSGIVFLLVISEEICKPTKAITYGGKCASEKDCDPDKFLTCSSDKKCTCKQGYVWLASNICKKKDVQTINGKCFTDDDCDPDKSLACIHLKCVCADGFEWKPNGCEKKVGKSFGEACAIRDDCDGGRRLYCISQKCACNPGLEWTPRGCERPPPKTFNGDCTFDDQCITIRQLVCINKKCGCKAGFDWAEGFCKAKRNREQCNPLATPKDCQKGGMECIDRVCRCPAGSEFSVAAKACKLKAGQDCFIDDIFQHDLCASQQCINDKGKKICACPEINGVTETWSSEPVPGCITEYVDLPCAGSDDECRGGTFNTSRQGLICKSNICQCAEGLTYKRGYCVEANRLFDDPCDPDGIDATCRGDAELTCQDIGGGDMRCVCLLRKMTVHGRKETVALSWNADQKKCDLKPNGARCNGGYECRIGYCRETCQRGIVERPKSAEPKLTNYKISTVLTFIFILILH